MFSRLLLLACVAVAAFANPVVRELVQHESRQSIPNGFVKSSPAPSDQVLTLRIALTQNDMAGLEKALFDTSTPGSALYGQHLSKEEARTVEAFVTPSADTVSLVNDWLSSNSITAKPISPAGDWLEFTIPVSKANSMLGADFNVFSHQPTGKQLVRTLAYSIPATLKGHVDLVHPTTAFDILSSPGPLATIPKPVPEVTPTSDAVPASCATLVTPSCLQSLYGIPTTKATQKSNTLGVSGFLDQFAQTADLASFLKAFRSDLVGTTFALQTLDDGSNTQSARQAGTEANLDTQYTVGVASGVPTTFISVGDQNQDGAVDGFLDIINFLLAETSPPSVLSTSYGFNEPDLPFSAANSLCNAYMQLGARGTSIIFSSGDGGVSGSQSQQCTTFIPTFPSGCPFVTSVGATTGIQETAATFSSGGFSDFFGTPSFQTSTVSAYLNEIGNLNSGKFNRTGRAFPDVSAQGENVAIFSGGKEETVAGTSCSTPIFASIISLLNDKLVAAGKPVLGFLNPLIYSSAGSATFTDITSGNNPGCNTNGFSAIAGWDPVTGFGTPNFAKLQTLVGL